MMSLSRRRFSCSTASATYCCAPGKSPTRSSTMRGGMLTEPMAARGIGTSGRATWVAPQVSASSASCPPEDSTTMRAPAAGSEEHASELQSLMRISYAVFCLKKKQNQQQHTPPKQPHYRHTTH